VKIIQACSVYVSKRCAFGCRRMSWRLGGPFACIFLHGLFLIVALNSSEHVGVSVARVLQKIAVFCCVQLIILRRRKWDKEASLPVICLFSSEMLWSPFPCPAPWWAACKPGLNSGKRITWGCKILCGANMRKVV